MSPIPGPASGPWLGSVGMTDLPVSAHDRDTYARSAAEAARTLDCPSCGHEAYRETADVGVGIIFGPWGCPCGWSEDDRYNQPQGPTSASGVRTDQWGGLYPAGLPGGDSR